MFKVVKTKFNIKLHHGSQMFFIIVKASNHELSSLTFSSNSKKKKRRVSGEFKFSSFKNLGSAVTRHYNRPSITSRVVAFHVQNE